VAQRKKSKKVSKKVGKKYPIPIIVISVVAVVAILLIWMVTPKFSDNVAAEFGEYDMGVGFGNNYFAGACNEGNFASSFYTMSGVSGRLTKLVMPIEVYDDPDAVVVADVRICEAPLGGACVGEDVTIVDDFIFTREWGFESGDKTIDVGAPFYVAAGRYYKISVQGNMESFVIYSMYKAEVETDINRYSHSAPGCSSNRPDVYVVNFWAI
jgi:hypothetical protein